MQSSKILRSRPLVKLFFDEATSTAQYIVACPQTKQCAVIDPVRGFDRVTFKTNLNQFNLMENFIKDEGLNLAVVLETHIHADHLTGADEWKFKHDLPVHIGEGFKHVQNAFARFYSTPKDPIPNVNWSFDHFYKDEETFKIGNIECHVIHTPGHTPACVTYSIGDAIFTGDTIFMPDSGSARCDFPGGSPSTLFQSVKRIYNSFPDSTRVFVGHDYQPGGRKIVTETSINDLKTNNIHIKSSTQVDEFVKKRQERDATLNLPQLFHYAVPVNLRGGLKNFSDPKQLTLTFDPTFI